MRLLWIATKPPVPPVDGGRLVALATLRALAGEGAEVTLVAPVGPGLEVRALEGELAAVCGPHLTVHLVRAPPRSRPADLVRSAVGRRPFSIVRHALPEVAEAVAALLAARRFDAVHAEQLQALAALRGAGPALPAGLPVVLRAQNVESDLWRAAARLHAARLDPLAGPWLAREARRLARYEAEAVRRAAATVALSARDAERLRELAGGPIRVGARVVAIPPPFPAELPAAGRALPGEPPLVLLGSGGWLPNRDATRWLLAEAWPAIRRRRPGARLHLFAAERDRPGRLPAGVEPHPPPADSRDAFAPGSILLVPLRIASGVRMKLLEAWARGVPAVASPAAAAGLEAEDGRELLIAQDAPAFATAVDRLAADPGLGERLAAAGRRTLASRHDPASVARRLLEVYAGG